MTPTLSRMATIATVVTLMASPVPAVQQTATGRSKHRFTYAVPVRCGFGYTNVNIHNPAGGTTAFTARGIPLQAAAVPTPPGNKQSMSLKADWALLLGCDEILALGGTGPSGLGNIIIESKQELDVWAVYVDFVAGGGIGGTRMERIPATISDR